MTFETFLRIIKAYLFFRHVKGNLLKISTPGVSPITTPNKKVPTSVLKTDVEGQDEGGITALSREQDNQGQLADSKVEETKSSENIPDDYQTCLTADLEDGIDSMIAEPGTELPSQNLTVATDSTRLNNKSDDGETSNKSWHPTQRYDQFIS